MAQELPDQSKVPDNGPLSFATPCRVVGGVGDDVGVTSKRVAAGRIDLSPLAARWRLLESLNAALDQTMARRSRSVLHPRMIDEGQTAGHRVYMGAERYLGIAEDNRAALESLLLGEHGLTPYAPWSLLRATFEASFYAVWLLDPEESAERRRRGLWLEWLDEIEHRLYYEGVMGLADGDPDAAGFAELATQLAARERANQERYAAEAVDVGLTFPPPRSINVLRALGELSCAASMSHGDVMLQSTWRVLSGMQHGRASTLLRSSDQAGERPAPGGVHVVLSVNDDAFLNAAQTTTMLHLEGVRLLLERSRHA